MTTRFHIALPVLFALNVCNTAVRAEDSLSLEVTYQLQRTEYCSDEPIAVEFKIKNTSSKTLFISNTFPDNLFHVKYTCKDPAVIERRKLTALGEGILRSGLGSNFKFKPDDTIASYKYVNHIKDYRKPGTYEIDFECSLYCTYEGMPKTDSSNPQFTQTGHFKITVTDEKLTKERLQPILARWSADRNSQTNVMYALSLVDDPLIIPFLLQYAREAPRNTNRAAMALRKFISTKEGFEALENLGTEFAPDKNGQDPDSQGIKENDYGGDAAECVFQSFRATERQPSEKFLIEQLSSRNNERVRSALDFLLDARQLANQAPLEQVEKLMTNADEDIAKKAKEVFEKTSKEKVRGDF